jgi:hypothetical protein
MSVSNILSKLKELNDANLVSVYVPSARKEMKFRPLSVKQQKDLIKSGLDGNLSGITLSNVINQIVLDNATEKHTYLVTDRFPVILSLRIQAFGSEFSITENEKKITFDLKDIVSRKLSFTFPEKASLDLYKTDLSAEVDVIALETDIKVNEFQLDKLKKNKESDNIGDTIGSLFIYEIVKFVTKIIIGKEEIDLASAPIKDRLSVIENIPATLNNKILDYIQKFRKEENEYITIDGNTLPVDARLFSKE